nr:hypothetical protein [Tanacetum cinerariifolium]
MFIQSHDPDHVPEPMYLEYIPLEDEHVLSAEEQPLPPVDSPTAESPGYVVKSDPEEDLKEYEDDESEDEPVIPPPSTDITTTRARITIQFQASISLPPEAEALIDAVTTVLPSPPLLPLPPPLYIPPPVNRMDDIPKTEFPPHKKSCLFALSPRYEVEVSFTTRLIEGQGIDYGFVSTLDAEARRRGIREVGVTELAELYEHDIHDLYALLEDAQGSRT